MNLSYLFMPTAKPDGSNRVHWLITLAEGLRYADKSDDLLWVKRDRSQEWVTYTLRLARTKVTATLQGHGGEILISISHQDDVDPTTIFLPTGLARGDRVFEITNAGLRAAVDYLHEELTADTLYSQAANRRILLGLEPQPHATPPIFFGGLIQAVKLDEKTCIDENVGTISNALLTVEGKHGSTCIRVGTLGLAQHPQHFKPGTRALASVYHGDYHEQVYTFSRDSLNVYYDLR
jgi:hypothetical protein